MSEAFVEDPVRILRIARFAARYAHLGFTVEKQTTYLMQKMVNDGEINALVAERTWQELSRALNEKTPSQFIKVLRSCGALKVLFPEFDRLFGVPQTKRWHPEVDTGIHCMMAMDQAAQLANDTAFSVFTHDLGKGITPNHVLPAHKGHEAAGVPLVEQVCERLKVPTKHRRLALTVCRWHLHSHMAYELKASTINALFVNTSAFQQPQQFDKFLQACQSDATGRTGDEFTIYPQADFLRLCFKAAKAVDVQKLLAQGYEGKALGEAIDRQRITQIRKVQKTHSLAP